MSRINTHDTGRIASMARFDESDADELTVVAECTWCGGSIFVGDAVYRINHANLSYVHYDECAEDYAKERVYSISGTIDSNGNIN